MTRRRLVIILAPAVAVLVVAAAAFALLDKPRGAAKPGATTAGAAASPRTTQPAPKSVDVDVLVYGTQTSGLAALHELQTSAPTLKVAVLSGQQALESPLAQGLCVEDRYPATPVMGFYKEWREGVIAEYQAEGKKVLAPGGRLSYEPEIAKQTLQRLIGGGSVETLFFVGQLVSASDKGDTHYAEFRSESGELYRVNARYFIDSSVEADLARMLGTDYRIGSRETTYNDVARRTPAAPSAQNGFATAPQKMATLLTLELFPGMAPRVSALNSPYYDPASYDPAAMSAGDLPARFGRSWTMRVGLLPDSKHELNEAWNDWPDDQAAFAWVFHPEERKTIYQRVLTRSINFVRYLQEHGSPNLGIAHLPDMPYVREGPRVVGRDTYTAAEIGKGVSKECISVGLYARFDRHQNAAPTFIGTPTAVHIPMGAIMPAGHPWLLVTTAISTDSRAYCSAVRMEPTRANIGGAAGIIIALAFKQGASPISLSYEQVRSGLAVRGYLVN